MKIARSLTHYYHKLSKRTYSQPLTASLSFPSAQSLSRPSLFAAQPIPQSHRIDGKLAETSSDLYSSLPDIFDHMIVESSPWSDVFHNPEPVLILSCCAPYVVLYASKSFLSTVLKVPQSQHSSILRTLFGTDLHALTSPAHLLISTTVLSLPSKTFNQNPSLFQQFYTTTLTRGCGQLMASFYDVNGNPILCLMHGYSIYNCEDSPFDYSLYRPTRYDDRSSSDHQLSSISLSSSLEPLSIAPAGAHGHTQAFPPPPKPPISIKDLQKSGEILYMVVAVSPLHLINESTQSLKLDGGMSIHSGSLHASSSLRDSSSYSSTSRPTRHSTHSSPRSKRVGSDGTTISQNMFLLYETERTLSVDDGVFDQEDPYEGASLRPDRLSSSTSLSYHNENPLHSKSTVDGSMTSPPTDVKSPSDVDDGLLNDL